MTLSISDIDIQKKRFIKSATVYAVITVLCIIFNTVYTYFGYGMYSLHMRWMFLFPMIGGIFANILNIFLKIQSSRLSFNLHNAAISTFIIGSIVQGIINISGRSTDCWILYYTIAGVLLLASIICSIVGIKNNK